MLTTHKNDILKITLEESICFAKLSGDFNPIHIDPVYSRRLLFGETIVHGLHVVLLAINEFAKKAAPSDEVLKELKVKFLKAIVTESCFKVKIIRHKLSVYEAIILQNEYVMQKIQFSTVRNGGKRVEVKNRAFVAEQPQEQVLEGLDDAGGQVELSIEKELATHLFPHALDWIGGKSLANILACTRIVGMKCPGLNSIFISLNIEINSFITNYETIDYKVNMYRKEMGLIKIDIKSIGLKGDMEVILRNPPVSQPLLAEFNSIILKSTFDKCNVVIFGGSRGIGEAIAKMFSAGGGKVLITYFQGKTDAEAIQREINAYGGDCSITHYDALNPNGSSPVIDWIPTDFVYCPTPPITPSKKWSSERFKLYCDYYVISLIKCLEWLSDKWSFEKKPNFYFLSTSFLNSPENSLKEYMAAKSAGEIAGTAWSNKRNINFVVKRLPRLPTDQTNGLASVYLESMCDVLYEQFYASTLGCP